MARATDLGVVYGCWVAAWACMLVGRFDEAIETSRRGRAAHLATTGIPVGFSPDTHLPVQCFARAFAGRLQDAEKFATAEYDRAVAQGLAGTQRTLGWPLAHILLAQGRIESAARVARESAALWQGSSRSWCIPR